MVNRFVIRNVLGIIGNVISFGLFLSPLPTFYEITKKKSVEQYKPDPYIMTLLNCAMWVLYGMPFVHPHNILVVTINGVGLAIELIYIAIFLYYSSSEKRKKMGLVLFVESVFFAAVFVITMKVLRSTSQRTVLVGVMCVIFNIGMYYSPLTIMGQVVRTKSVKYMPFWLTLTCFLNGSIWTAYALLEFDPWMVIPNGLGSIGGVIQLILYAIYYKTTDWSEEDEKKPTQVELAV